MDTSVTVEDSADQFGPYISVWLGEPPSKTAEYRVLGDYWTPDRRYRVIFDWALIAQGPLTVADVMNGWRPGSTDHDWEAEIGDLFFREPRRMYSLVSSISREGLRDPRVGEDPITLGSDGRVWQGHHRIIAAHVVDPHMNVPYVSMGEVSA